MFKENRLFIVVLRRIIFFLLPFICLQAKAQDKMFNYKDSTKYELGAEWGTFLPFGIPGVRDQLPMWGAWFAHPTGYGALEWMGHAANAEGVTYYNGTLSLRVDFIAYDFIDGYFRMGADVHTYKRKPTLLREFEFFTSYGSHVGFGVYMPTGGPVWLRSDFKFAFGPGNTLFVHLGLVWRFGGEEDGEGPPVVN